MLRLLFIVFVAPALLSEQVPDFSPAPDWKPYVFASEEKATNFTGGIERISPFGNLSPARFLSVDRLADKYPSFSPYVYAANNPLLFIDPSGDSVEVSPAMVNNQALANLLQTQQGFAYVSQFAYKGQTINVNGTTFTFDKAGKFASQNLVFAGMGKDSETMPVNSVLGRGVVDKEQGVQSYEVYLQDNKIGNQMDALFHETQHASMFAGGSFSGNITQDIADRHHAAMMLAPLWTDHERFIMNANSKFNTGLNAQDIYIQSLWNRVPEHPYGKLIRQGRRVGY